MANTYWQKQTSEIALFPELLWSKPENKNQAGKLLIIGGNIHGFSAPANSYNFATKSGIGTARILLPDKLKRTIGRVLEMGEYAPSTPSGSFSQKALDEVLSQASWADGVLLAGDFGKNSETAILLEKFLDKYGGPVALTNDAIDFVIENPDSIKNRPNTTVVLSIYHLQKLVTKLGYPQPISLEMPLNRLVEVLNDFSQTYSFAVVVKQYDAIFVTLSGKVSSTAVQPNNSNWQTEVAARAIVWCIQNTEKPFESLTTAVFETGNK